MTAQIHTIPDDASDPRECRRMLDSLSDEERLLMRAIDPTFPVRAAVMEGELMGELFGKEKR